MKIASSTRNLMDEQGSAPDTLQVLERVSVVKRICEYDSRLAKSERIPALDGLRGVAILSVLSWHGIFQSTSSSILEQAVLALGKLTWSGVDLFFVLSGFLICGILLDARNSSRYFSTFYIRRAYRILPVYAIVVSLFCLRYLPLQFLRSWVEAGTAIPFFSYATFTQNLWMALLGGFGPTGLAVTWSLAVEEQFYLTIPVAIRKISRAQLIRLLTCVVICIPVLRTLILLKLPHGRFANYVLMPCRADALCMGALAATLVRDSRRWKFVLEKRILLHWVTLLGMVGVGWMFCSQYDFYSVTFGYSCLAFFYTCCLLVALMQGSWINRVLCRKWLIELGRISYCVYLIHLPLLQSGHYVIRIVAHHFSINFRHSGGLVVLFGTLVGTALSIAIARISWRIFEEPMLRRGYVYKY
jgi:peptidoglycan/LPS O-acetylase OafA/YrhL